MRYNESDQVMKSLSVLGLNIHRFNCMDNFLNANMKIPEAMTEDVFITPPLKRTVHPEHKRMIIGDTFIRTKDAIVEKVVFSCCVNSKLCLTFQLGLSTDMFFAQGTVI